MHLYICMSDLLAEAPGQHHPWQLQHLEHLNLLLPRLVLLLRLLLLLQILVGH
jgi:hypothetical protein